MTLHKGLRRPGSHATMGGMNTYEHYRKLLDPFIAIPSISTDSAFEAEMSKTAAWLVSLFNDNGFETTTIDTKDTNPIVVARYTVDPELETILIYGHYDVQPADQANGWQESPFKVQERDGRLICRGAIDNKGQVLVHMVTIFELIAAGNLAYNIKFMIEGNEETGSPNMPAIVEKHKDLLACDHIMISDGETANNRPTIEASLRGGFNIRVQMQTGKTNLHSGLYGGAAPSAAKEAAKLVASFYGSDGRIAIDGFYDGVSEPTEAQIANNTGLATDEEVCAIGGFQSLDTETGHDFFTQVGLFPTIQVSGLDTGYTGEGFNNIVPAQADLRLNVRTAPTQDAKKVLSAVLNHIKQVLPDYVTYSLAHDEASNGLMTVTDSPIANKVAEVLEKTYGEKPVTKYVGGSIPIVVDFKQVLGKDTLLVSLANEDCNMHGVDENFDIEMLHKALAFSREFFSQV